ncbi:MAG: aldose epimerase [Clostridiales bacterium]|nr:MAG: aldose epimerase [Clostridiales bacterium]
MIEKRKKEKAMIYSIENKILKATVDTSGAQLQSIYSKATETEYLWQGDPAYWAGRAYNLFPTIGRMYKNTYTYDGNEYSLRCHGIARYRAFQLTDRTATKLTFRLTEDEDSLKEYPFKFEFFIRYELKEATLEISLIVKNTDEKELIFALGGHPGFNVPFGNGAFEDYYLEFSEKTKVLFHTLSESKFMTGEKLPLPLTEGVRLPLRHELFDNDAAILGNTCREISLKSKADPRYITVKYPDFRYLGVWHTPETDAPFVCIEPWSALPATDGVITDLSAKEDMTRLAPGKTYKTSWSIEIHE